MSTSGVVLFGKKEKVSVEWDHVPRAAFGLLIFFASSISRRDIIGFRRSYKDRTKYVLTVVERSDVVRSNLDKGQVDR